MSSRVSIVAISFVAAIACNQRGSKQQPQAGTGTGTGTGTGLAIDAGPPAIDASLSDGTLQLVGIDVLTAPALFQQRAAGAGPKPMEPLVHATRDAVRAVDQAKPAALGDRVVVWLAVRPKKQARAWIATPGKSGPEVDAARTDVVGRLAMAAAPEVSGPVAFTITFDRSGVRPRSHDIPVPPELAAPPAAGGDALTPEALIERAWKP